MDPKHCFFVLFLLIKYLQFFQLGFLTGSVYDRYLAAVSQSSDDNLGKQCSTVRLLVNKAVQLSC